MTTKTVLHIPSLPAGGETLDLGGHIIQTKQDYNRATARNLELILEKGDLEAKLSKQQQDLNTLSFDVKLFEDLSIKYKEQRDKALYDFRLAETRAIKAEKQNEQTQKVNKSRSERISRLQTSLNIAKGELANAKKQLKSLRDKNPKQEFETVDAYKIDIGKSIKVRLYDEQIHVCDLDACYMVSTLPLDRDEYLRPRFFDAYIFDALLKQHSKIADDINAAIFQLGMIHRRIKKKPLVSDMAGGISVKIKQAIWDAGIEYASDINKPESIRIIKRLPGVGDKTLQKIIKAAKEIC